MKKIIYFLFALLLASSVFAADAQQLRDNTVSYYCLDEANGIAIDCYRGYYNLTQGGTVNSGAGILGTSRGTFTDTNQFNSVTFFNFTGTQSYTISRFVFAPGAISGSNTWDSMTSANYARTTRYDTGSSKIQFMYLDGGNSADSGALSGSTWYHVVSVYNGSSGNASVYVNGVFRGSGTTAGTPANNNGNFKIGRDVIGGSASTSFRVDELAVFNATLTPDDVMYLYNATVNGTRYWNISSPAAIPGNVSIISNTYGFPRLLNFSAYMANASYNTYQSTTTGVITALFVNATNINVSINSYTPASYLNYTIGTINFTSNMTINYTIVNLTAINGTGAPLSIFNMTLSHLGRAITYNATNGTIQIMSSGNWTSLMLASNGSYQSIAQLNMTNITGFNNFTLLINNSLPPPPTLGTLVTGTCPTTDTPTTLLYMSLVAGSVLLAFHLISKRKMPVLLFLVGLSMIYFGLSLGVCVVILFYIFLVMGIYFMFEAFNMPVKN